MATIIRFYESKLYLNKYLNLVETIPPEEDCFVMKNLPDENFFVFKDGNNFLTYVNDKFTFTEKIDESLAFEYINNELVTDIKNEFCILSVSTKESSPKSILSPRKRVSSPQRNISFSKENHYSYIPSRNSTEELDFYTAPTSQKTSENNNNVSLQKTSENNILQKISENNISQRTSENNINKIAANSTLSISRFEKDVSQVFILNYRLYFEFLKNKNEEYYKLILVYSRFLKSCLINKLDPIKIIILNESSIRVNSCFFNHTNKICISNIIFDDHQMMNIDKYTQFLRSKKNENNFYVKITDNSGIQLLEEKTNISKDKYLKKMEKLEMYLQNLIPNIKLNINITETNLPLYRKIKKLNGVNLFIYFKDILLIGENSTNQGYCTKNENENENINKNANENISKNINKDISKNIDKHEGGNNYDIHKWLSDIAVNSTTCINLFVEKYFDEKGIVSFKNDDLDNYKNPLEAVKRKFEICNSNSCPTEKINYHMIDIRELNNKFKSFSYIYEELKEKKLELSDQKKKEIVQLGRSNFENIVKYLSCISDTSTEFGKSRYKDIMNIFIPFFTNKTKGQFPTVSLYMKHYEEYRQEYIKFISDKINNVNSDEFLKILIESYKEEEINNYDNIVTMLANINMDIYFLLTFINENKNCKQIIFCESHHIKLYSNFIKKWFKILPLIEVVNKYENQCMTLEKEFDIYA